jgi:phage shock protein C
VNPRRLYRSRDRQLAGVAGGMAEYLDIDPTIMRILWILAVIVTGGLALLVYLVLALVVPASPYAAPAYAAPAYPPAGTAGASVGWSAAPGGTPGWAPPAAGTPARGPDWNATPAPQVPRRAETRGIGAAAIVGVVLIVLGGIALADAVLPGWSAAGLMWPAVILALGAALLVASIRRPVADASAPAQGVGSASTATAAGPVPADASPAAVPWEATDTQPVAPVAYAPIDAPAPGTDPGAQSA